METLKGLKLFSRHRLILIGVQDREISKNFIFSSRGINHKIDHDDTIVVLGNICDISNFLEELQQES